MWLKTKQGDGALYMKWSYVVDGPTYTYNREQLSEFLRYEWCRHHPNCIPKPGAGPEGQLARLDEYGTTGLDKDYGWNDDDPIAVRTIAGDERSWRLLSRDKFHEFASLVRVGATGAAWALTEEPPPERK